MQDPKANHGLGLGNLHIKSFEGGVKVCSGLEVQGIRAEHSGFEVVDFARQECLTASTRIWPTALKSGHWLPHLS